MVDCFHPLEQIDHAIGALAHRQRGYVTHAQLCRLGLSRTAIARRVGRGWLIRVHQGVYAVGHLPVSPIDRAAAAVLACGRAAVLSHGSALTLWGLARQWTEPFEVTAPAKRTRPGIRTHRSRALTRADRRIHLGIPTTTPARALLDCAPRLSRRELNRAFQDARRKGLVHVAATLELLERRRSYRGAKALRQVVAGEPGPTRSELEDAFLEFVRRFGLPQPQVNVRVGGREVDALFAAERVIVELDGYDYHSDRETFEADRERDAEHAARFGLLTVRLTHERLSRRPEREAQRLQAIFRDRSH